MLLSVGASGTLRPCCNATNAVIWKDEFEPSRITDEKPSEDVLNTKTHIELREEMLDGIRPSACQRCWTMEDAGAESFRHAANKRWNGEYNRILEKNSSLPSGVRRIELDLGTKCNLKCRMCGPYSSSLIQKEMITNNSPEVLDYYGFSDTNFPSDWVDVKDIRELLSAHAHTLEEMYLIGGEPLIIPAHTELLEYLVETGHSKHIKLIYNTNGITIGNKFIELWKQFRHVHLSVSIDGMNEQYEYIRFPAKWNTIEDNLKQILSITNISVGISTTIQNLTLSTMAKFIEWANNLKIDVNFIPVNYPTFLSPHIMPKLWYLKYIDEIEKVEITHNNLKNCVLSMLSQLKANVENCDATVDEQKLFIKRMETIDKIRKQNLFDVHPWAKDIV
jgi:sulfatase maturation enzyme AslB (radical SAM superfamily)